MAINVADGFQYLGKKSLDARTQYATLADMKAVTDANINEGCLAYCSETDKYYKFLSTNNSDEETGKWREYESGGGLIEGYAVPVFGTNNEFVALLNEATGYEFPSYNDEAHTAFMAGIGMSQYPNEMAIFLFNTNDSYLVERINTTQIRITNKGGHAINFESATSVPPNGSWGHTGVNIYGQSTTTEGVSGMDTIYIRGNITISDNNFVRLPDPLKFYEDKEHTVEIEPEIGKQYIDRSTNKMYRWNGVSYVCISGEFDDSTLYSIEDEAETTLADADYFPFYDVSASTKKKSLWSNIKSVLKTYFDSLYNPKLTAGQSIEITNENVINAQMPVMSTFTKSDLYSTTEKVIGCWTDGRPIYQKVINFGAGPNKTEKSVSHGINNISTVIDMHFFGQMGSGSTSSGSLIFGMADTTYSYWVDGSNISGSAIWIQADKIHYISKNDASIYTYKVVLKYTKTSDPTNSYYMTDGNDYSTLEKVVGTWLNGETLYQRTFTGTFPSSFSSDGTVSIASSFTYSVYDFKAVAYYKDGTAYGYVDIPYYDGASGVVIQTNTSSRALEFFYYGGDNLSYLKSRPYYVTVKYTK